MSDSINRLLCAWSISCLNLWIAWSSPYPPSFSSWWTLAPRWTNYELLPLWKSRVPTSWLRKSHHQMQRHRFQTEVSLRGYKSSAPSSCFWIPGIFTETTFEYFWNLNWPLFCPRGIVNTYGVFQSYYETNILSSQTSSNISWIGSIQAFLLLIVGILTGPIYDAGFFRTLIMNRSFLVVFGMIMTLSSLRRR